MARQPGFFDQDQRLQALSAAGDPLERLAAVVDFEVFRSDLVAALSRWVIPPNFQPRRRLFEQSYSKV